MPPGSASAYSLAVLADHPIAYYRLQETSGTTVFDASGNGRHATLNGGPTRGATGPLAELAYDQPWNRSNCVSFPSSVAINNTGPCTIEFWVKMPSGGTGSNSSAFVFNGTNQTNFSGSGRLQAHFSWGDGNIYWDYGSNRTTLAYPSGLIGVFAHCVLTGDDASSQSAIWFNNSKLAVAGFGAGGATLSGGTIGCWPFVAEGFVCAIAEFAIYNYALSDLQIANHYNATDQIAFSVRDPQHTRIPGIH